MMDISKHPVLKQCHEVCTFIEECGASEELTKVSMKASALLGALGALISGDGLSFFVEDKEIEPAYMWDIHKETDKKSTIFLDAKRTLTAPSSVFSATKRRICYLHLKLAEMIQESNATKLEKEKMLNIVDESFNKAKRMGDSIDDYREAECER